MVDGGELVFGYSPLVAGMMVTSIVGSCQEHASESFLTSTIVAPIVMVIQIVVVCIQQGQTLDRSSGATLA